MIRLVQNKLAISPIYDPDVSKGGIIIPDIAKEKCDQGIVKYIGPKVKYHQPGDYVLFGGYDGTTVHLEDEGVLIIMREPFIKCIIDPPDTTVPGMFFQAKANPEDIYDLEFKIRSSIVEKLGYYLPNNQVVDSRLEDVIKSIIKLAQSHPAVQTYFPATYEMAVDLISQMWTNHPISKDLHIKNKIDYREKIDHLESKEENEDD